MNVKTVSRIIWNLYFADFDVYIFVFFCGSFHFSENVIK